MVGFEDYRLKEWIKSKISGAVNHSLDWFVMESYL